MKSKMMRALLLIVAVSMGASSVCIPVRAEDQSIVTAINKQIDAMPTPYKGYSSIADLDAKVERGSLSQFNYSGLECVTYAILRMKEKLLGKDLRLGVSTGNGKEVADYFIRAGFGVNGSRSGERLTAKDGQKYGVVAYTNDGGRNITSNSWVCFNSTSSPEEGHVVYVEEVAEINGVKYVYYTEGGGGYKSWPVKKKTFDAFYNNWPGYTGTVVFYPDGTPPAHTEHVKGAYLFYEADHPHYNYYTCSVCGQKFTDGSTTTVNSCPQCHSVHVKGEYQGYLQDHPHPNCYRCTVCGMIFHDDATSNFVASCSICHPSHKWEFGAIVTEPTFTTEGSQVLTCTVCGKSIEVAVPMLDSVTAQYSNQIRVTYHRSGLLEIEGTGELSAPYEGYVDDMCIRFSLPGFDMFDYLDQVTRVNFGEGITALKGSVFGKMKNLEEIHLPQSLTYMDKYNFAYSDGYPKLKTIHLTSGVSLLDGGWIPVTDHFRGKVFANCTALTSIEVDFDNPYFTVRDGILYDKEMKTLLECPRGKIGGAVVPDGVEIIAYEAFSYCKTLEGVSLPASVTKLGSEAFSGCESLASISLPGNISWINMYTFSGCSRLTSVFIPGSVTAVGMRAFSGCNALRNVYYGGTAEQWKEIQIDDSGNDPLKNAVLHTSSVPASRAVWLSQLKGDESTTVITVMGDPAPGVQLVAAFYDAHMRLLDVRMMDCPAGGKYQVQPPKDVRWAKAILLDANWKPVCSSMEGSYYGGGIY